MQSTVGPLLIVVAIAANGFADDGAAPKNIAERLSDIRKAYATAQTADAQAASGSVVPAAAAEDGSPSTQARLPRIDPRSLLPKEWLGAASDSAARRGLQGSTGARLRRDLRRGKALTGEGDIAAAIRPSATGRAGSALSGSSTQKQPTPAAAPVRVAQRPTRATAALARSIAADVAGSLEDDDERDAGAEPVSEGPQPLAEAATPVKKKSTAKSAAERIEKVATRPNPSGKTRAIGSASSEDPNGRNARVSVATDEPTSRLPLTIGNAESQPQPSFDRYTKAAPRQVKNVTVNRTRTSQSIDDQVLVSQRMPVIVSRVAGPRTIVVGREATYRVTIENRGDAPASRLIARITAPEWAQLVSTRPSSGDVEGVSSRGQGQDQICQWRMDRLSEGGKATLDLRLIAKVGRPIELGVSWEHAPVDSTTVVEVQEPKIAMHLAGPDEVLFGKSQIFRLTVSNPGTGVAERVRLRLTPPGKAQQSTEHSLGEIAAGESRSVEIELTAREAGALAVEATATADGGLEADVTKEIFCRKAELAVDWRGPDHRYAGAPATYFFRVRNPGTAVAQRVELDVQLPAGFDLTPGADTPEPKNGRLTYRVGTLRPGDDRYFELRGVMNTAGTNTITLQAAAEDDTRSEPVTAATEVVALADLKLDVEDPPGPTPTGQEVAYKIRVTNRGASEARDVRVVGLFSEGIEPGRAEGNTSRIEINDGRVAFGVIESIPAGADLEFTIYARAHAEGTHLFRTEVTCRDLEIQLAEEETTKFFEDQPIDMADSESGYRYQR